VLGLAAASAATVEINSDNIKEHLDASKSLFVKFYAP